MKRQTIITLLAATFLTTACGGGDGGSDTNAQCTKTIFSTWTSVADPNVVFRFDNATFDTSYPFSVTFESGARCDMDIEITGAACSGVITTSNAYYVSDTGSGDPGCASFNATTEYDIQGVVLTATDDMGSGTYE